MSVENFLDTNIFVSLFDETDADKRARAEQLVQQALENETGTLYSEDLQHGQHIERIVITNPFRR
jgi:predicted nucleic acid-binding protein